MSSGGLEFRAVTFKSFYGFEIIDFFLTNSIYILYFHIFHGYFITLTLLFEKSLTEPADKVSQFTTFLYGDIERDV